MSIIIGQGETKSLIYKILDKDNMFSQEDTLLFALKSVDNNIIYTYEKQVNELTLEDGKYIFLIELSSNLTNSFSLGNDKYFFDLTLVAGEKRIPITNVKTVDVIKTVGASISEV